MNLSNLILVIALLFTNFVDLILFFFPSIEQNATRKSKFVMKRKVQIDYYAHVFIMFKINNKDTNTSSAGQRMLFARAFLT